MFSSQEEKARKEDPRVLKVPGTVELGEDEQADETREVVRCSRPNTPNRRPSTPNGWPQPLNSAPGNGASLDEMVRADPFKLNWGEGNTLGSRRTGSKTSNCSDASAFLRRNSSKMNILKAASKESALAALENEDSQWARFKVIVGFVMGQIQKYSVPLVTGVLIALVWTNVDAHSYEGFVDGAIIPGAKLNGADLHGLSLHFIVNDIFMCFFFGLAIKEVTEALLPGGSLSPLKRAINPLLATAGGVVGPVAVYAICVGVAWSAGSFDGMTCLVPGPDPLASHGYASSYNSTDTNSTNSTRRLGGGGGGGETHMADCTFGMVMKGWGVPTATDISLAWMFAILIFGVGHPAINFLLLLAIVDDALGMVIIAVFYSDPAKPVQPAWLGLVVVSMVLAFILRKLKVPSWPVYILFAGPVSWLGLFWANVHPALALVFVVPWMPAEHAITAQAGMRDLGACDLGPTTPDHKAQKRFSDSSIASGEGSRRSRASAVMVRAITAITLSNEEEAPLHLFEHHMKLPVDLGMFFFGLANAGVKLKYVGGVTTSVVVALVVGKTLGIALFSLFGCALGFGLPDGLTVGDLFAMSAIAGVGLTVALFVANQAYVDPTLRGQAKMGAVISVACGGVGWLIKRATTRRKREPDW